MRKILKVSVSEKNFGSDTDTEIGPWFSVPETETWFRSYTNQLTQQVKKIRPLSGTPNRLIDTSYNIYYIERFSGDIVKRVNIA